MRLAVLKTYFFFTLAALLVACGGGGGSSANSDAMTLQGYAAKGTLQGAQVDAYEIKADGTVSTVSSGTSKTDKDGNYTLAGLSKSKRFVIKVSSVSGTTHLDEMDGQQDLSAADFVMTATSPVADSAVTPTVMVNITPFSHQVVTAALKAGGGKLSALNLQKAKDAVATLYGFDPEVASRNAANGMLYAVSFMAKNQASAIGCGGLIGASATVCTINNLAQATQIGTVQLNLNNGANIIDLSAQLKIALDAVPAEKAPANITALNTKLNCKATNDCDKVNTSLDTNAKNAIAQVKSVLDEIATDLQTLFSQDGATSTSAGKFNQQAYKFMQTADQVQLNTNMFGKDLEAMLFGARTYQDVKNGVAGAVYRGSPIRSLGNLDLLIGIPSQQIYGTECTLLQDAPSSTARVANAPGNANFIGCISRYGRQVTYNPANATSVYVEWRHGYHITPLAFDSFTYIARAYQTTWSCPGIPAASSYGSNASGCTTNVNMPLHGYDLTGSFSMTKNATRDYSVGINGDVPPGFVYNGVAGPNVVTFPTSLTHHRLKNMNWRFAFDTDDSLIRTDLSGLFEAYNDKTKVSDVSVSNGSFLDNLRNMADLGLAVNLYGATNMATATLRVRASSPMADQSGAVKPSRLLMEGSMSNNNASFLTGSVSAAYDYSNYDSRRMQSATNTPTVQLTATLSLTAPNQPRLEFVIDAQGKETGFNNSSVAKINLSYRRYVGASSMPSRTVTLTLDRTSPDAPSGRLSEVSSGLMVEYTQGKGKVFVQSVERGELSDNKFNFTDYSFVSFNLWP